jgi:hypothetical protein
MIQAANAQELFILVFAFQLYEIVWSVLEDTGMFAIPFILVFWNDWVMVMVKKGFDSAEFTMRKIPFEVILRTSVMLFVYAPIMERDYNDFVILETNLGIYSENSVNGEDAKRQVEDRIEQDIEQVFDDNGGAMRVPAGIELAFVWSRGLAYEIIERVHRSPNIRELESLMFAAAVKDPTLYAQVQRFTTECFVPGRNRYYELYSEIPTPAMKDRLEEDPSDLTWLGSHILLSTQSLYAECNDANQCNRQGFKARSPVDGFEFDAFRDQVGNSNGTQEAFPYCDQWWLDGDDGLRQDLLDYMVDVEVRNDVMGAGRLSWYDQMKVMVGETGLLGRDLEDNILRHFLRNTHADTQEVVAYRSFDKSRFLETGKTLFTGYGTMKEFLSMGMILHAVKISLPIIQTVLFFAILVVVPFFALLSLFDAEKAMMPLVAIFLVSTLSYFWYVIGVMDNWGLRAMGMDHVWSSMFGINNFGELENTITMQLWSIIIGAMYIGLPYLAGVILGQAGGYMGIAGKFGDSGVQKGGGQSAESAGSTSESAAADTASSVASTANKGNVNI